MKRRALLAAVGILSVGSSLITGCGGSTAAAGGGTAGAGGSSAPLIGSDYPRSDTDFWNAYIRYTPTMAAQVGVGLKTTNSANDVARLTANVQTLMGQGVKAVVMAPQDTAAAAPVLAQLAGRKIPVVTIDTRPDTGNVFMVVRADNRAYGVKACHFLGTKLKGTGTVVELQGDVASINGKDRSEAFAECMRTSYPGIKVLPQPSKWDPALAASQLAIAFEQDKNVKGVYMQASFALSGTLQLIKSKGLAVPPSDPRHVFVVSNDGIPQELKDIGAGLIDATVSQPADLYAKYGLFYAKAALSGTTFRPGPTDHGSTIVQVRDGVLEDQLAAPLVTADGAVINGEKSLVSTDPTLWGNQK